MADELENRWPVTAPPAPEQPNYEPIQPGGGRGGDWRERLKKLTAPIVAVLIAIANFAAKFKIILVALPKLKLLTTSGSMLVSIAAYTLIWGFPFAAGFVVLLLVHEMGHVWQLRREGIEASAPMFIPFLGAMIAAKSMGDDAAAEARVGLAGPILGTIGSLIPLGIYFITGDDFWRALAYVGFFLNLFNLLPVLPLDGGRAMAALSPWVWFAGFAGLIAMTIFFPNPILILIVLLGGYESWRRFKQRNTPEGRAYHAIPARTRALVAIVYLGLIAALALGVYETHLVRDFGDA